MNKKYIKGELIVTKKGHEYILSDKGTKRVLHRVKDVPICDVSDLERPHLAGIGSVLSVAGNYYSFEKYLLKNNDRDAIISDWKKVGIHLMDALCIYGKK